MRAVVLSVLLAGCAHPMAAPVVLATDAAPAVQPVQGTPALVAPMARLSFMRGVWVGQAAGTAPDGTPYVVTQTERMGPMLGGDIIVIEGRGYRDDGSTGFNAFAVLSFDLQTQTYELRSYTQGMAGTFELQPTDTGYVWEIPAGADAVIRFTATVEGDHWREVGEYVTPNQPPVQTFEMNLERVGDTDWPLTTPVAPDVAPSAPGM